MKRKIIYTDNCNDIPDGHLAATVTRTGYTIFEKNLKANPMYILIDFTSYNDGDVIERTIYMLFAGADIFSRIGITSVEHSLWNELVDIVSYQHLPWFCCVGKVAHAIRHPENELQLIGLVDPTTGEYDRNAENSWSNAADDYYVREACGLLHGRSIMGYDIISPAWMIDGSYMMLPDSLLHAMHDSARYIDYLRSDKGAK